MSSLESFPMVREALSTITLLAFISPCVAQPATGISDRLVGTWKFVKTMDHEGVEVKTISKGYKGPDGNDVVVNANGPEITLRDDRTYVQWFTTVNADSGMWQMPSEKDLELLMVIPIDSRQGQMVLQTEQLLGKKWPRNPQGDLLDSSTHRIAFLSDTELHLVYETSYVQVFHKE